MTSTAASAPLPGLELLRAASEAVISAPRRPPPPSPAHSARIHKKRGRKPTPGLSDEDRRQARLLKNRRTAEKSRRRKLAYLQKLQRERDGAVAENARLRSENAHLRAKLGRAVAGSDTESDHS